VQQSLVAAQACMVLEHELRFWHCWAGGNVEVEMTLHDVVGELPVPPQQSSLLVHVAPTATQGLLTQ
jgi:hypothetical protein